MGVLLKMVWVIKNKQTFQIEGLFSFDRG